MSDTWYRKRDSFSLSLPRPSQSEIEFAQSVLLDAAANGNNYSVQYADPVGKLGFHESTHGYATTWRTVSVDLKSLDMAKANLREAGRTGRVVRLSSYLTNDGLPAVHSVILFLEVQG